MFALKCLRITHFVLNYAVRNSTQSGRGDLTWIYACDLMRGLKFLEIRNYSAVKNGWGGGTFNRLLISATASVLFYFSTQSELPGNWLQSQACRRRGHCDEWDFMRTFPGNQNAAVK